MNERTKIYLTILGLLALTGVLSAATPTVFSTSLELAGVAATRTELFATGYVTNPDVYTFDCMGNPTVYQVAPGGEKYIAIAPTQSTAAGFTPRDVFVTYGPGIYKATPPGPFALFAVFPCNVLDHTGITFDKVGTFGFNMIVTCQAGGVWTIDGTGTVTLIAETGAHLEGPAVAPLSFGPLGGQILAADEFISQVHAIKNDGTVTLNVFSQGAAEGVFVIPETPCTFCSGGAFFQVIQTAVLPAIQGIYQYPLADFSALGGSILVTSEYNEGTAVITWDGTNYVQSFFDNIPGGQYEGSSFVDCDVPTPTPTPTSTPTSTPRPRTATQPLLRPQ